MLPRVPYLTQIAILEERAKGRTDRQIERVLGLSHGLLSRPYRVDTTVEAKEVASGREHAAWRKREAKRWEAEARWFRRGAEGRGVMQGWRPKVGDLLKARPKPHKPRPKPTT